VALTAANSNQVEIGAGRTRRAPPWPPRALRGARCRGCGNKQQHIKLLCRTHTEAPPLGHLALAEARGAAVAAVAAASGDAAATGALRVLPWPPRGDAAADARPHGARVTGLAVDARGAIVFSCDAAGVVVVSALLPALPPDERPVRCCLCRFWWMVVAAVYQTCLGA
jgi:hypothetical protein